MLEQPVLFFDIQTTGIRPPVGRMIEIGFSSATATTSDLSVIEVQKFSLPEGSTLSKKVIEITGYSDGDLAGQPDPEIWCKEVLKPWLSKQPSQWAVIHYAQFEIPYLQALLGPQLPFSLVCTHQITRRLFPTLPSQNIRAVAGFFGHPMLGPNRAGDFTRATQMIWRGLATEFKKIGITSWPDLNEWLQKPMPKKKRQISYLIHSDLRLKLPDQPGIYRMLAKTGEVLYVGKATSLKDRVNSYFRGVKNREKRKLEMLAQTWDLQVETCASPLEAALLEAKEIKRLNPRYNVALKRGNRKLCFYSEDFLANDEVQSASHPIGPFRPGNLIDMVISLHRSIHSDEFEQIFYEPLDPQLMKMGFELFLKNHGLKSEQFPRVRSLLAFGLNLHRHYVEPDSEIEDPQPVEVEVEVELTAADLAAKFERLLRRSGAELVRAKKLTAILQSDVEFLHENKWRRVSAVVQQNPRPWSELDIESYDHASILLSELSRLTHRIVRHLR